MALRVASNVSALNAQRNLNITQNMLSKSLERLSSGLRINKASDDAAGLSISQNFRADIASFQAASRNASQANSMLQTAEGGMDQIHNMLTRLKELSTQAASDNVDSNARTYINSEAGKLVDEIDRIAQSTNYAGTSLLDGTFGNQGSSSDWDGVANVYGFDFKSASAGDYAITSSGTEVTITTNSVSETVDLADYSAGDTITFSSFDISFKKTAAATDASVASALAAADLTVATSGSGGQMQIGAQNSTNDRINLSVDSMQKGDLGIGSLDLSTLSGALSAMDSIDSAIDTVNSARSDIGANQNRLSYASANLATSIENATAADSIIRDTDVATEMTQFTKSQILQQAGTAMLAQANALPQAALSLLK
jgi:flagellin